MNSRTSTLKVKTSTKAGGVRTIVKFIALLTLLNWAVALHFVSAAEVPGQQQTAQAAPIPWNEIGAAAGKQYQGDGLADGLAVAATEEGARLHCVFQKLEGHATRDGLWLVSTTAGAPGGRFSVTAQAVGRGRSGRSAARERHGTGAGHSRAL
ncbi:MAG: hypothetical protein L0Z50_31900 [Verrucomicrobiales bacterium]|nr:hypothetical protein [Verrucomicrobiales bacterium]